MEKTNTKKQIKKFSKPERYFRRKIPFVLNFILCISFLVLFIFSLVQFSKLDSNSQSTIALMILLAFISASLFVISLLSLIIVKKKRFSNVSIDNSEFDIVTKLSQNISVKDESNENDGSVAKEDCHKISNYSELYKYYLNFMQGCGIEGRSLTSVFASIIYSKIIFLHGDTEEYLVRLAEFYNQKKYVIEYDDLANDITEDRSFAYIVKECSYDLEKPVFVKINGAEFTAERINTYLNKLIPFFRSPTEKFKFMLDDEEITFPSNIMFIFALNDDINIFDIDKEILKYACYLPTDFEYSEVSETQYLLPVDLNDKTLKNLLREVKNNYAISEEVWKRMDIVIDALYSLTDTSIDNKMYLRLENYATLLNCFSQNEYFSIDESLSSTVMTSGLLNINLEGFNPNSNVLLKAIENNLGSKTPKINTKYKIFVKYIKDLEKKKKEAPIEETEIEESKDDIEGGKENE